MRYLYEPMFLVAPFSSVSVHIAIPMLVHTSVFDKSIGTLLLHPLLGYVVSELATS